MDLEFKFSNFSLVDKNRKIIKFFIFFFLYLKL
jgi:hypothetical protein